MVDADMTRLTQVVSNLLNNAARYTPDGGLIGVAVTVDGGWTSLTIADSGIGISPGMLPHIFDMFTQGDRVRSSAGRVGHRIGPGASIGRDACRHGRVPQRR